MTSSTIFDSKNIRNVCILAHVDHGKTTLSDYLIASNGLIHRRSVGKVRYLDTRGDEQNRSITMKSSCITLHYKYKENRCNHLLPNLKQIEKNDLFLINLIDSPGHVDFSSEVASAVRLCDGALLLVDAVEGVSPQTRTVFKQAWRERVKLLLVINKMDRLIIDLRYTPLEAYKHLQNIIEQINAMAYQFRDEEMLETDEFVGDSLEFADASDILEGGNEKRVVEEAVEFSPLKGNIVFCSALHGWCFTLCDFGPLIASKLNLKDSALPALYRCLWGENYFNAKTKRISRRETKHSSKPMFVQFILDSIWKMYEVTLTEFDRLKLKRMLDSLSVEVDVNTLKGGVETATAVFHQWLPLADGMLNAVLGVLPNPVEAALYRVPHLCPLYKSLPSSASSSKDDTLIFVTKFLAADIQHLRLTGDKLIGNEEASDFVGFARIFRGSITNGSTLYVQGTLGSSKEAECKGRVAAIDTPIQKIVVDRLFLLIGPDLIEIHQGHPGSVLAVLASFFPPASSLAECIALQAVDRCITLTSTPHHPPFTNPFTQTTSSILRVSIEPAHIKDMETFLVGLNLLYRADPAVQIQTYETGEHVIGCLGEVHLERCINDLQEVYCRIPLIVSEPLVAIRETLHSFDTRVSREALQQAEILECETSNVLEESAAVCRSIGSNLLPFPYAVYGMGESSTQRRVVVKNKGGSSKWVAVKVQTPNKLMAVTLSAFPIPTRVLEWIDDHAHEIELLFGSRISAPVLNEVSSESIEECTSERPAEFELLHTASTLLDKFNSIWRESIEEEGSSVDGYRELDGRLLDWSIVNGCANILMRGSNASVVGDTSNELVAAADDIFKKWDVVYSSEIRDGSHHMFDVCLHSFISGFRMAASAGPLAEEPMRGVCFVLECIELNEKLFAATWSDAPDGAPDGDAPDGAPDGGPPKASPYGPLSGQIMSAVKEGCRCAILQRGRARIYEAMLHLELQCEQTFLGKAFSVLAKRRGQVLSEDLREGTSVFTIKALIPASESFGIAQNLRTKASGHVSLHLQFSHWELNKEDPFPEAYISAEELEEGQHQMVVTSSRKIINSIRKRKGLVTEEKVIVAAEKQRTLGRSK